MVPSLTHVFLQLIDHCLNKCIEQKNIYSFGPLILLYILILHILLKVFCAKCSFLSVNYLEFTLKVLKSVF